MQKLPKTSRALLAAMLWLTAAGVGSAQQGSFPSATAPPLTGTPGMTAVPPAMPGPTSTLQAPTFDPYASGAGSAVPPSLLQPPTTGFGAPPTGTAAPPGYGAPYGYGQPPAYPGTMQPNPGFGTSTPPVLFPQGMFGTTQPAAAPMAGAGALKTLQNIHFSECFLGGNSDTSDALQINDLFVTTTIALPNFFWTQQPWFISPGFGLHLWSGPFDGIPAHDLPPNAYSAFLDLGWQSDPNRQFGAELGGRIGVFSDFNTFDSQSVRPSGVALARFSLTPTMAVKGGVVYLNRAEIKLLPAVGVLWTPNPQTRWDIFFPQPKLSSYLTTVGRHELWWYLGAEYGGGAWTVQAGAPDFTGKIPSQLIDINDIRVFLGMQVGPPAAPGVGQLGAFVEIGYVFDRTVYFVATPDSSYGVANTFMLRGGFAF